ncbi:MAG: hypothetical protein V7605_1409 [Acidimicrobiaceae bacterium]
MRASPRGPKNEQGAIIILFALTVTAMISMAALVLDLAQLRASRRANKTVADMSVRAGLGVLQAGPWSGVCRAGEYLKTNSRFPSFDPGSEKWFKLGSPLSALTSSPCLNTSSAPFVTLCLPGQLGVPRTDTWGKLTATAGGGRYSVEIQSGYSMPDSRFPEDLTAAADTGDPLKGSCDNLVVIIKETRSPIFAGVIDRSDKSTTIRSVGRLSNINTGDYNPALLLLEQHGCAVLTDSSNGGRVIAQPYLDHPGVLQIDSADDQGGCAQNQAVLNGKSTSGGPSIVACSAKTVNPSPGCNVATADKPSRTGIFALNFTHSSGDYVTSTYPSTYGDTQAVPSAQSGRTPIDSAYRGTVAALDSNTQAVITGNGGKPPGCTTVTSNSCTGSDGTWLVLQQTDCNSFDAFFSPVLFPLRAASPRVWFNCNLTVNPSATLPLGLILSAPNSYVVITGSLSVTSTFAMTDPRKVYIGGKSTGNKIGLDIGNGGNLNVGNPTPGVDCLLPSPMPKFTKMVVGNGSFNVGSSGAVHLCATFVFMASGYGKVPATDGTPPCGSPCSGYLGTLTIGSGSHIDWLAPNLITNRRPTSTELQTTSPFEDVALWTEAGGNTNGVNGGGDSKMTGVYFIGNADSFTLAGNSGANVYLSAQFISTTMKVTGGAVVNLVLNPFDSIPFVVYELVLVR